MLRASGIRVICAGLKGLREPVRQLLKPLNDSSALLPVTERSSFRAFHLGKEGAFVSPLLRAATEPAATSPTEKLIVEQYEHVTGLEREEVEAQLQGKSRFELEPPSGPFGTKEAPAVIESYFNERIVGCSGGLGEEEHDIVWFKLKKDVPHECSVCGQYFTLKVLDGGPAIDHH
eukprot:TRINITY_DN514_c0_g1_i2.p1 TRINITY_DN514_c0_g1~~TRINITY_DN514_c0_g1_i2.p1  ORF type:complete len:175 (+),score=40.87 TRINITY_DN514_c0_g1_i2:192-716(+)